MAHHALSVQSVDDHETRNSMEHPRFEYGGRGGGS